MKSLQELRPLIIEWAREKNLISISIAPKQRLKLLEEVGELAHAILRSNVDEQKDAVGDIFVVLTILNAQTGSGLEFDLSAFERTKETDVYEVLKNIAYVNNGSVFSEISLLNDVCHILKLDIVECANLAYNTIKDRTGKTLNGTFIKD